METKRRHGTALRWGLATALSVAVAAAPPVALAARMGPVPSVGARPVKGVTLEVKIAAGLVESADLRRWIDEDARRVLEGLPEDPTRRGSLRIEIGGALYEYQVSITTSRDGAIVGTPSTWECDCSNGELLERLRAALPTAAEGLAVAVVEEPVVEPEPVVVVEPVVESVVDEPRRRRLGATGAAGVTLMVLGATGVGAGAALMVIGDQDERADFGEVAVRQLADPGRVIIAAGGGVVLTGIVLYLLRKRLDRPSRNAASVAPTFDGHGGVRLSVAGRF